MVWSTNPNESALPTKPKQFALLPKTINAGVSGIIGTVCVFPLDLVKTRLQVATPNGEKMYKSILDCFKKTYRAEGFIGMYRGVGVNVLLITPEKTIKLVANDLACHQLSDNNGNLSISHQFFAGGLAGTIQTIVTTPMDLLKIQMQNAGRVANEDRLAGRSVQTMSGVQLAARLYKDRGLAGLYQGVGATIVRTGSFSALFFPMVNAFKQYGPRRSADSSEPTFWVAFLAAFVAATVTSVAGNPLDVIKTRMQAVRPGDVAYKNMWDCARQTWRNDGPLAFYNGGWTRVLVNAPSFAIILMVYYLDVAERLFGLHRE